MVCALILLRPECEREQQKEWSRNCWQQSFVQSAHGAHRTCVQSQSVSRSNAIYGTTHERIDFGKSYRLAFAWQRKTVCRICSHVQTFAINATSCVCVCPSPSICGALQLLCASHWRFIEKSSICMRDEVVRAPLSSYRWNSLFFGIRFYLYFSSSHCVCGRCECVRVSVWLCVGETDSILFRLAATDSAIRIRLMLNTFSGVVVHMSFASPIRFLFYCYLFRVSYRAT